MSRSTTLVSLYRTPRECHGVHILHIWGSRDKSRESSTRKEMLRNSHARSLRLASFIINGELVRMVILNCSFYLFLALLNNVWFNAGHSSCISKANVLRSESSGHQRDNQYYILCFWPLYSFANNLWKQVRGIIEQLVNVFLLLLLFFFFALF